MAFVLAACAGGGGGGGDETAGQPQRGGTLKIVGSDDVTHLDTAAAYYVVSSMIERAYARRLVTYPATTKVEQAGTIIADAATQVPTKRNGGISQDGMTYTFKIKQGVQWNTDPARQVTAKDFARGLERLCNPVAPAGAPQYYRGTIVGFAQYCDQLSNVDGSAQAIGDFIRQNDIQGVQARGDRTLVIQLRHPTPDFLNIMAMGFASAAPQEYLQYVPSSAEFDQNIISNGPYQLATYEPDQRMVFTRNPAWNPATDDVRNAYVNRIEVTLGLTEQAVQQQIEAGEADMQWDTPTPTSALPRLYGDSRLELVPSGSLNKYVVFNMTSPNENRATSKLEVRQAIAYALNKRAIGQVYGGPRIATPANTVLPQTSDAYQQLDLYPTQNDQGNAAKARQLLAQAGYPDGLTLKMIHRNAGNHPDVAQTIQASLRKAGINVKLQPVPEADFYSTYLENPQKARNGVWDIVAPGWVPDWFGNNARTYVQPLFSSKGLKRGGNTWGTNWGFYDSEKVNGLIQQATTAPSERQANQAWQQAQRQILRDVAIVPTFFQRQPQFHSERVQNFNGFPHYPGDITNVWLQR